MANLIPDPSGIANSSKYYVKVGDACVTADNFPGDSLDSYPIVDLESGDLILDDLEGLEYLFITNQFQVYSSASLGGLAYTPVSLYQDLAGTIPALAPGDKIARWDDVVTTSGLSLTQPDESLRPELQFEKNSAGIWVPVVRFWASSPSQLIGSASVDLWANKRGGLYASYESTTTVSGNPLAVGGGLSLNWNQWRFDDPGDSFGANDAIDNGPVRWSLIRSSDADHDYYEFGVQVSTKANDTAGNYSGIPQVSNASGWAGDMHGFAYTSTGSYRADIDSYLNARSPQATNLNQIVVVDGNELTLGVGASNPSGGYPDQLGPLLGSDWLVKNFGVVGQETPDMSLDAATQIDPAFGSATKKVLIAWEGSNHLFGGATPAQAYTEISQYCQARRDAGEEVIVLTVLPRSDAGVPGGFEADRQTLNTSIRDGWTSFADGIVDVAADSRIGDSGDETGSYYSGDDFTLNNSGYAVVAGRVNGVIPALDETISDLDIALRVEEEYQDPTTRQINGTVRYANATTSGSPRQMQTKYGLYNNLGTTDYALLGSIPNELDFQEEDNFTISLWVLCSGSHDAGAFIGTSDVASGWEFIHASARQVVFNWFGATNIKGAATAPIDLHTINQWTHLVARWDGVLFKIFVNGVDATDAEYATGLPLGDASAAIDNLRLFQRVDGTYEKVRTRIDDVRIYDTALSNTDIATLASATQGQVPPVLSTVPICHWTFEDAVLSPTLRNSGSLKEADLSITGSLSNLRSELGYFSYANTVGYGASFTTDGVDDYIDTQVTLDGATAYTVWRRAKYLSTDGFDFDGFFNTNSAAIQIGRNDGVTGGAFRYTHVSSAPLNTGVGQYPNGEIFTSSLSASGDEYTVKLNGAQIAYQASGINMGTISNSKGYYIGAFQANVPPAEHYSNTEYYEYLIASRLLTSDELAWLDSGGTVGTAIDFVNDPDILLYYDFENQHPTLVENLANPALPGIIVGGEWSRVPASDVDTTKDVEQDGASYTTAFGVLQPNIIQGNLDLGAQYIPSTGDFDLSFDFVVFAYDTGDTDNSLLTQYTAGVEGRFLVTAEKGSESLAIFIGSSGGNIDIETSANSITIGKWHTARVTRVGDLFTLYLDGQAGATATSAVVLQATNTFLGQSTTLTSHDEFYGLITNVDFGDGNTFLTTQGETSPDPAIQEVSFRADFDGASGPTRAELGITPIGPTDDYDISMDILVNSFPAGEDYSLITQYTTGGAGRSFFLFLRNNGTLLAGINGAATAPESSVGAIQAGRWYNVRATRVGNVFAVYIDGVKVAEETNPGVSIQQQPMTLAGTATGTTTDRFDGIMANVRIESGDVLTEYLTRDIALPGATLTNATVAFADVGLVDVIQGRPGTLTYTGLVPRDAVISSPAPAFNGSSEHVSFPGVSVADLQTVAWDITLMVKDSDTTAFETIWGCTDSAAANSIFKLEKANTSVGSIQVRLRNTAAATVLDFESVAIVFDGEWHKVRLVHDGSNNVSLYVDDVLDSIGTITPSGTCSANRMSIAALIPAASPAYAPCTVFALDVSFDGAKVGTWPACESSGEIVWDVSGNGNHGTGAPTARTGTQNASDVLITSGFAKGMHFDGASDSYSRATLVGGATRFCVAGKVLLDALSTSYIIASEDLDTGNQQSWFVAVDSSGNLFLKVSSSGTNPSSSNVTTTGSPISAGQLHSFSITWEGGTVVIEVDGVVQATTGSSQATMFASTADFHISGRENASSFPFGGVLSHLLVHKDPTVAWTTATKAAIRAAGTTAEVQAIVDSLGGTAWYFPDGSSNETLQGLASGWTTNGTPEERIIPAGAGVPISYGPGVLAPGQSLDLYCGENESPYAARLSGFVADGIYAFGDGNEGNIIFTYGNENYEELVVLENPDSSDRPTTILDKHFKL